MIKLGSKVKDIITGFEGVATGRCEWLTGCIQFCVVPKVDKDGKRVDVEWIDEMRLEKLEDPPEQITIARAARTSDGGPQHSARQRLGG